MQPEPKQCALLLSGGMDSTTLLGRLVEENWIIHPIIFNYSQRHAVEIIAAQRVAAEYVARGAKIKLPKLLKLDLRQIGGSSLTDSQKDVPNNMEQQIQTVVPFRNMLFLTMAAAYADSVGITDIFITPVQEDYAAYRDCRIEFYEALEKTLALGATYEKKYTIHTPFIGMPKKQLIKWGQAHSVPYHLTHTCYLGQVKACGTCPACQERLAAFKANNLEDPIAYETVGR